LQLKKIIPAAAFVFEAAKLVFFSFFIKYYLFPSAAVMTRLMLLWAGGGIVFPLLLSAVFFLKGGLEKQELFLYCLVKAPMFFLPAAAAFWLLAPSLYVTGPLLPLLMPLPLLPLFLFFILCDFIIFFVILFYALRQNIRKSFIVEDSSSAVLPELDVTVVKED
jgi:hypothetical protein